MVPKNPLKHIPEYDHPLKLNKNWGRNLQNVAELPTEPVLHPATLQSLSYSRASLQVPHEIADIPLHPADLGPGGNLREQGAPDIEPPK